MPPTETIRSTKSGQRLWFTAASTPSGMPSPALSSNAAKVSSSVAGRRWAMSCATGRPENWLAPKSSRATPARTAAELDVQRLVQSVLPADLGDLRRRRIISGQRHGGVGRHSPDQQEGHHQQPEQRGQDQQSPPQDEAEHLALHLQPAEFRAAAGRAEAIPGETAGDTAQLDRVVDPDIGAIRHHQARRLLIQRWRSACTTRPRARRSSSSTLSFL